MPPVSPETRNISFLRNDGEGKKKFQWPAAQPIDRIVVFGGAGAAGLKNGAGDGGRTRDVQLGKLAFYH